MTPDKIRDAWNKQEEMRGINKPISTTSGLSLIGRK